MNKYEPCIAAIATGAGGAISIIRLSGSNVLSVVNQVWKSKELIENYPNRSMQLGHLYDRNENPLDHALAVFMPGPHSYTGEDLVEIHTHGGAMITKTVLRELLHAGANHAEAGEFTKRAFINGKIDLTQAEAVSDLIQAQSEMALHAASKQLDGQLGKRVAESYEQLNEILGEIEVRMDFVDEELDWTSHQKLNRYITAAIENFTDLLQYQHEGEILRNGVKLAIIGAPNAGKSSLLNLILGHERAIVTDIAGTTRDTLEEQTTLRGIPIHLVDTAGIRESNDVVEQQGVNRSYQMMEQAQLILYLFDQTQNLDVQSFDIPQGKEENILYVVNKSDMPSKSSIENFFKDKTFVSISAKNGDGFNELLDAIEKQVWQEENHIEPEIAINARHADHLMTALTELHQAMDVLEMEDYELVAINLRVAIDAIGNLLGKTVQADVLDYIFGKFCIGK